MNYVNHEYDHIYFMKKAIEIAKKGYVSPNPRVGAVLVKDNQIIATGYHQQYGGSHAEINTFNSLPLNYSFQNTTLYVSLEPCSHYGKTPPCTQKIIELGISKVVVACLDPNPLVSGKGIQMLQNAGIEVIVGILKNEAEILNESFFKFITTNTPFILLKSALSLDGKISSSTGKSQWISSEESRLEVHHLRSQFTAIMIGINTVLTDNPLLTSRIENGRNPIRIILDSSLQTPIDSKIAQTANHIKTIIVTLNTDTMQHQKYSDKGIDIIVGSEKDNKIDLKNLMQTLGKRKIDSILLEAGAILASSALKEGIVDKIQLYYAPIILGGVLSKSFVGGEGVDLITDAVTLDSYSLRVLERDFVLEGYIKNKED